MHYRIIEPKDNLILANIIRDNLKANKLDIPGTVYFDENLNNLSDFYLASPQRAYFIALDDNDNIIGGIGLAELGFMDDTAELQKLYLTDAAKGQGLSYELIDLVEETALNKGYKRIYLETHTNLKVAIHLYEKCGYKLIEKPKEVVHSSMNRFYLKELL
ncbi:putative acetyltransferase [Pseudobutyrivibrio sp. OR37]|uniref:GNAT family N-acetyltransferase n=1 Tax=Pseudobutyrivibrio sp. OR37 TaxID=1798186 RepID=UPI0008E58EA3|nr:GNAT family N-acetyltransferase [Pseudobutyrivibrio sp. OR37]SFI40529.1 putative acetyltransferase [Pseudobutyrivibrio sp. OR37]